MNSPVIIVLSILAAILIGLLVWLLRQSQQLKLDELSSREKLLAREAELGNAKDSVHESENQNASLRVELQSLREHKSKLETSLEMEKNQHKLIWIKKENFSESTFDETKGIANLLWK